MRPSDFLIDLNDFWGRLIPGILILFDLYMLQVPFVETTTLIDTISKCSVLATGFLFVVLLLALILGELSLFPILRIRRWLSRPTAREEIHALDVTVDKAVTKFFEQRFSTDALDAERGEVFSYCKEFLLEASPSAYAKARRMEARINLKGGVILPLLGLLAIAYFQEEWILLLLCDGLLVVFWIGFVRSFSNEYRFVYRTYTSGRNY